MSDTFFTTVEYSVFAAMVRKMRTDAFTVARMVSTFGAPRTALDAMAEKYAADHALAYGEHAPEQCDEWCSFPTGNEAAQPRRYATAPTRRRRHVTFFDK